MLWILVIMLLAGFSASEIERDDLQKTIDSLQNKMSKETCYSKESWKKLQSKKTVSTERE